MKLSTIILFSTSRDLDNNSGPQPAVSEVKSEQDLKTFKG